MTKKIISMRMMISLLLLLGCLLFQACESGDSGSDLIRVYRYVPESNTVIEVDIIYPDEMTENDYLTYDQASRNITQPTPTGSGGGGTPNGTPPSDDDGGGGGGGDEQPW